MRIAVYSGSFNPLHIGHLAIMQHLRDRFDWTYLVVSPKNPLKDSISADTGTDRYRAAVQAVCRHPELKVWVEDIELGMEPPHYTIRTLDTLRAREPGNSFTLVVGADQLALFTKWKDYARILREYGLIVFPRKGFHRGWLRARLLRECPDYRITLARAPRIDISSTEIRDGIAAGKDMSPYLM
jgi:nicotinate-nucleotide adenylyltransferase